ncbi:hypothetical protein EI42_02853 [Thermosporothrix hazakensis]|uniref:HAMP domain-containing protein n=3 Tax=Thermosporothrix TaxID=768650 RepID=A0A326UKX5_THEHA|nr:hypothetical protein EI42_02853 [Thermosporothrix hazakensis]BBH85844.1 hypothetical protein KTC_05950 [Thermosporothrix sp. COM3]GCE45729.1 hypothetical protein KTH_05980 [Thermosporothrix hazakensis]
MWKAEKVRIKGDSSKLPKVPSYLRVQGSGDSGLLGWWYRLAAPEKPGELMDMEKRETYRRGRLASLILLALLFLPLTALPLALRAATLAPTLIVAGLALATIFALVVNRFGSTMLAGWIAVCACIAATMLVLLCSPRGISVISLPILCILVIPELLAASLLPPRVVFGVALFNCGFAWWALAFLPHTTTVARLLELGLPYLLLIPTNIYITVALIAYLWVRSAGRAIARADRAEEIARLEHDLAIQMQEKALQMEQLDQSIEQIIQTQTRVANGDLNARVPLTRENLLWPVAGSLNNIIARLQRARSAEEELERTRKEAEQLVEALRELRHSQEQLQITRGGTVVDAIAVELATLLNGRIVTGPLGTPYPLKEKQ